jgi:predicted PurR-regulated permease PerM
LALWVAGLYLAVQTVESNFVTPLIQQRTIHLPPAYVFAAQLVFGLLFGLLGLALATPIAAALLTIVNRLYVAGYLDREAPDAAAKAMRPGTLLPGKAQLAKRK